MASSRKRYNADQARQLILEGIASEEDTDNSDGDSVQSDESSSDSEDSTHEDDIVGASGDGRRRENNNRRLNRESNVREWTDVSRTDPGPTLLEFSFQTESGLKQVSGLESPLDFFKLFFIRRTL